jgi:hypothetical protein
VNLDQFRAWALAQGSVGKYQDGSLKGQCVSLVNQYCWRVINVPAEAWGHAYAWGNDNNPNREWLYEVSSIQAGDIIVYGKNFTPVFGHIGIALGGGQILDQNGRKPLKVAQGAIYKGYEVILRRKAVAPPQEDNMYPNREQVLKMYERDQGRVPSEAEIANFLTIQWWPLFLSMTDPNNPERKAFLAQAAGFKKITDIYEKI